MASDDHPGIIIGDISELGWSELEEDLDGVISEYDRDSLLSWIVALSVTRGNEKYFVRFLYLKYCILREDETDFGNKELDTDDLEKILDLWDSKHWAFFENFESFENNSENIFEIGEHRYNFLSAHVRTPELSLQKAARRYFEFDSREILDYGVRAELQKLLEYQTRFVEVNERGYDYEYNGFNIPEESMVDTVEKLLKNHPDFSESLWEEQKDLPAIDHPGQVRSLFKQNPMLGGKLYCPNLLIDAFDHMIVENLRKLDDRPSDLLNSQLKREVTRSLGELVPPQAFLHDFEIEGVNSRIDIGFISDNQFFVLQTPEVRFNEDELTKEIECSVATFEEIQEMMEEDKIVIKTQGESRELDTNLEVNYLIVKDEIDTHLVEFPNSDINFTDLSYYELDFVFKRLNEEEKDIFYFSKALSKFDDLPVNIKSRIDFANFLEMTLVGKAEYMGREIRPDLMPDLVWSDRYRDKMRQDRPMVDIRPSDCEKPQSFDYIDLGDNLYYAYNNIIGTRMYCSRGDSHTFFTRLNMFNFIKKSRDGVPRSSRDAQIIDHFANFLAYSLNDMLSESIRDKFSGKDTVIDIFPKDWALENGLNVEEEKDYSFAIAEDEGDYIVVLDPENFAQRFDEEPDDILRYVVSIILPEEVSPEEREKLPENINQNLFDDFDVQTVPSASLSSDSSTHEPSQLEMADAYVDITTELDIEPQIYRNDEALTQVKEIFDYFLNQLSNQLEGYDSERLIKLAYAENEKSQIRRRMAVARLVGSSDKTEENLEDYRDKEESVTNYSPVCRLLAEYAVCEDMNGDNEVSIGVWKELVPLAQQILNLSQVYEYLHFLPDFLEIEVEVSEYGFIDFEIEGSPYRQFRVERSEGLQDSRLTEVFPQLDDEEHRVEGKSNIKDLFSDSNFDGINRELEAIFGFDLVDYSEFFEELWSIREDQKVVEEFVDQNGLVKVEKNKFVDYMEDKSNLATNKVENIVDFLSLDFEESANFEPWKIDSRQRLAIQPIVYLDESIIFGLETFEVAESKLLETIFAGKWPLPGKPPSKKLEDALNERQHQLADKFEENLAAELESISDHVEMNLCQSGVNDGMLRNIKEECPGEVDAVSIHMDQNRVILWEAKDIKPRFGAREIGSAIEDFFKEEGYIDKVKKKERFLQNNLETVLETCNFDTNGDFSVDYAFVLSEDSILRTILNNECNIIHYSRIEDFVGKS